MTTMEEILTFAAWLPLIVVALPDVVITLELLAGNRLRALSLPDSLVPDIVVLVPAHNEAAGIAPMLARVMPLLPVTARLLVVADNCTDQTAALARMSGAEVAERHDPTRRGKGYALAYGRAVLAEKPPAVVIVLDADCVPEPGALERLARGVMASGRTVQGSTLIEPRPAASPMVQISGFAFLVKNRIRQAGLARLGAPAVLNGTGMAFPWTDFMAAPLDTGEIVEDLAIGIALARRGASPRFDPAACIWTPPAGDGGMLGQRTRWEHGFMKIGGRLSGPLILEGLRHGRPGLMWLGLHIAVPPLALLLGVNGAVLLMLVILWLIGASYVPLATSFMLVGFIGCAVLLSWYRHGRDQVSAGALARVPLYLLWKLPIYLKLVRRGETRWIRTDRT